MMKGKSEFSQFFPVTATLTGLLIFFCTSTLYADTSSLVKDINLTPGTMDVDITYASSQTRHVEFNGIVYFAGGGPGNGTELWRTDGTASGTYLVKDIAPGELSSSPAGFKILNGTVYFSAEDGAHGRELWKTDGTEQGTALVKDINPGLSGSHPESFFSYNGKLLFRAYSPGAYKELWHTDGTSEGTQLLKDISPNGSSFPSGFIIYKSEVYFNALGPSTTSYERYGFWKTDGTVEGTVNLNDLFASVEFLNPKGFVEVGGILYFASNGGLWRTDGTETGTYLIKQVSPSGSIDPNYLLNVNGTLFFVGDDDVYGDELWVSDGTEAGTRMVKDIRTGSAMSFPTNFAILGDFLYFRANSAENGTELWKSDGTEEGTQLVADVVPGTGGSSATPMMVLNDKLYFQARDANERPWLWQTDGTPAGTSVVTALDFGSYAQIPSIGYPHEFVLNGRLYFTVDYYYGLTALWLTDGTTAGTQTFPPAASASAFESQAGFLLPSQFTGLGGEVFFTANDGVYGVELWKTDGSFSGTQLVKDIMPGPGSSNPSQLQVMNGILYFVASTSGTSSGDGLWRSDGTEAGTYRVGNVIPDRPADSILDQNNLTVFNNKLYFRGSTTLSGIPSHLWESDGTDAGTIPLSSRITMPDVQTPAFMTVVNTIMFFSADGSSGYELYKFDGSNVQLVKDLLNGLTGGILTRPANLVATDNLIIFQKEQSEVGQLLFRSDGTANGTYSLKKIDPFYNNMLAVVYTYDGQLTAVGNDVYFLTQNETGIRQLWKTDGTLAETTKLAVFDNYPNTYTEISNLTAVGNKLFFRGFRIDHGYELWVSDGTLSGTRMVKDIRPGPESSGIDSLAEIDGVLYFAASGEQGNEIWKSDGTEAGTVMVADVIPGSSSSSPRDFFKIEQGILHNAYTPMEGRELRILSTSPLPLPPPINNAPEIAVIDNQVVNENALISFTVTASDIDHTMPSLGVTNLPQGASFIDNGDGTGSFEWQTNYESAGDYLDLTFTATDAIDNNLSVSTTMNITVVNVNRAPELGVIADQIVEQGNLVEFSVNANDPDGTIVALSATGLPASAELIDHGDSSGSFSWDTTNAPIGNIQVTVLASDGNLEDSQVVTITVESPPIILPDPEPTDQDDPIESTPEPPTTESPGSSEPDNTNSENNKDDSGAGSMGLLVLLLGLVYGLRVYRYSESI